MVSLKDVSAVCGVSVATVSKALNDHNDVSKETKARIRKVAAELGYMPNAAAKALKTKHSHNIGILFTDETNSGLAHDYYTALLNSFKRTTESMGYDLTFINSDHNQNNTMSYLAHARYRGFDGICAACVDFKNPEVIELLESDFPMVTIDHICHNKMAVVSDNIGGMRDLVNFVYRQGHRKIAYIHGTESPVTQARLTSFYKTTQELGLDIPEEYILEAPYRNTGISAERTNTLLSLPDPPTCILYPDDFSVLGGANAIRQAGLHVPENISIAGYDGLAFGRHISPRLATVHQDTDTMGQRAAELLISLIEHPKTTLIETVMVHGTLYEGETVARIADGAE